MYATLSQILGIELDIVQAPMAGVQNWELALAVSEAGGLGSIPCGMLTFEQVVSEVEAFTARSSKPYNLNFFCHDMPLIDEEALATWQSTLQGYYDLLGAKPPSEIGGLRYPFDVGIADAIEAFKPPVISFHFGLPSPDLVSRIKSWGSVILSSATTVEEGVWLQNNGADMVIAQGIEAGGHRAMFLTDDLSSQMTTNDLVSELKRHLTVPIIAAGGIGSSTDVERLMVMGCCGVQIGTAFLLCDEAKTSQVHRSAIQSGDSKTEVTTVFSGRPARGIINKVMLEQGFISSNAPAFPYASIAMAPLRAKAELQASGDFSPLWAGMNFEASAEGSAADLLERFEIGVNCENKSTPLG
ncbi:NAD(P)H-dependent flavin oxidoreductase [Vibrio maritimus]